MGHGMGGNFQGVGGQITAIKGSTLTLTTFRGETATVKVTSSTQFRKDGAEIKLADLKAGDPVIVNGSQDKDGVWTADLVRTGTGHSAMGMGAGMGHGGPGGMRFNPEDNGKTFIAGEVAQIAGTKITVKKPDSTTQVIEVDDNTSFLNERRESVTLADVKVGDFVRGQGELKNGVFVPKQLRAGKPVIGSAPSPGAPAAPPVPPSGSDNK